MMSTKLYLSAAFLAALLVPVGYAHPRSAQERASSTVVNERRAYVVAGIGELKNRAEVLRKAIKHRYAACDLLQQMGAWSAHPNCNEGALAKAEKKISSALGSLKASRDEARSENLDSSEQHLSEALEDLSRAGRLLAVDKTSPSP